MVLYMNCVPSFTRKLLILEKISSYNNTEAVEVKKYANCDIPCYLKCPDECKDDSVIKYLSPTSPVVPPPSSHHSSSILLLMLCILGAALFFVSYLSMIRYRSSLRNYRRRSSQPVNDDHEDFIDENQGPVVDHPIWYIRTVGLQQSIIESIEVFKYRKGEGLIEGIDCSVCLSEFQEDENLRLLPKCSHAFHIHCIDTWLMSHKNCPLCRAPIVNDPNAALVNTGEPNFSNSGSREENQVESVDNHADSESDEGGENGTIGMRVQREGTVSLPIEEENNVKEILEKNYGYGPAKKNKVRGKSDLADHSIKVEEEMEPVRRSISMGSNSAAMVYLAMANYCPEEKGASSNIEDEGCSNVNMVESMKQDSEIVLKSGNRNSSIYRFMKSSSLGRSLQKVPTSVKRSFSSSGKSSLRIAEARIQTEYNEH